MPSVRGYMRGTASYNRRVGTRLARKQAISRQKTKNAVLMYRGKKPKKMTEHSSSASNASHKRSESLPSFNKVKTAAQRSARRRSPQRPKIHLRSVRATGERPHVVHLAALPTASDKAEQRRCAIVQAMSPDSYSRYRQKHLSDYEQLVGPCAIARAQQINTSRNHIKEMEDFFRRSEARSNEQKTCKGKSRFQSDIEMARRFYGNDFGNDIAQ